MSAIEVAEADLLRKGMRREELERLERLERLEKKEKKEKKIKRGEVSS